MWPPQRRCPGDTTRVTFTLRAELSGLKKVVKSKAVENLMNSEIAALDTAKALLEST